MNDESNNLTGADHGASPETARSVLELKSRLQDAYEGLETRLRDLIEAAPQAASSGLPPSFGSEMSGPARAVWHEAALRAIGNLRGPVLVVDCHRRSVQCVGAPDETRDWRPWEGESKTAIIEATGRLLALGSGNDARNAVPLRVGDAVILSVAPIAGKADANRFAAVHLERATDDRSARHKLSRRESEVAHLLCRGYSNVNIAAMCGVSTNTVRTFMRRLYRKLVVCNRAELVREVLRVE